MRKLSLGLFVLSLSLPGCQGPTTDGTADGGVVAVDGSQITAPQDGSTVQQHVLAAWVGEWIHDKGVWKWACKTPFGGSRSGTHTEQGNVRRWTIAALDEHRIRVVDNGSEVDDRQWNYVIAGNLGTIEEGSFSGGVDVDKPGNKLTASHETLTLRSDGSLWNEVFYEFKTPSNETCTEQQEIALTRP